MQIISYLFFAILLINPFFSSIAASKKNESVNIFVSSPIMAAIITEALEGVSNVKVSTLTVKSGSMHNQAITPKTANKLLQENSIVVFSNSATEPFIYRLAINLPDTNRIELAGDDLYTMIANRKPQELDDTIDGHFWLTPDSMLLALEIFSQKILKHPAFAQNKNLISVNIAKIKTQVTSLKNKYTQSLTSCKVKKLFVTHGGYFYLKYFHKLRLMGPIIKNEELGVMPRSIKEIVIAIEQNEKICILSDSAHQSTYTNSLLKDVIQNKRLASFAAIDVDGVLIDYKTGLPAYLNFAEETLKSLTSCVC